VASDFALGFKIRFEGDKALIRKLKSFEPKVRNRALRKGLRAGSKVLKAEAVRLAPKKTGAVKRNIKVRAGKRSRRGITMEVRIGKEGNYKGDQCYGAFAEFGTKDRRKRSTGQRTGRVQGLHFMERAYVYKGPTARDAALAEMWREVRNIAAGN
jgi:HK97 gp10 family phage protein